MLRTPIVSVLGHVDHGKTSLLDRIRGSSVAEREAGAITQHIGATEIPLETIGKVCGELLDASKFRVPGLLFIDTPGHRSFTTLRSRGGALSDIAILVVDVNEGFRPQTIEAVGIMKAEGTPFLVAANKLDLVEGWNPVEEAHFQGSLDRQSDRAKEVLNERVYELVGELHDRGYPSDRFDRVRDFSKSVGIVPVSAHTGEGVADLLSVLVGMAQRFMEEQLSIDVEGAGTGTVLEVKEERGLGTTIDVILYDGYIETGDEFVVGSHRDLIVSTVRALLKSRTLEEMREKGKFQHVDRVHAASGVKVAAPDLEEALPGSMLRVVEDSVEEAADEVRAQLERVVIETGSEGTVVKADTLGSLEAVEAELGELDVDIRRADIGDVSRRDVIDAGASDSVEERVVLAFNVSISDEAASTLAERGVKLFTGDVIYRIIEGYEEWLGDLERSKERRRMEAVIRPGEVKLLPGHVFRRSDPAVVGVSVVSPVKPGYHLIDREGERVGRIKEIQKHGESIDEARPGEEVAVSIAGPTVGRQIKEGETLYVDLPEKHARVLSTEMRSSLSPEEEEALREIVDIRRRKEEFWGM